MEEEARLRPPARRTAGAQRVVRTAEPRRCSLRGCERHDTSMFATYTSGSRACVLSFKDRTLCHSKVVVNLECICRSQCSKLWFVDCCVLSEKNLLWGAEGRAELLGQSAEDAGPGRPHVGRPDPRHVAQLPAARRSPWSGLQPCGGRGRVAG